MSKKKACKQCKIFVEGDACPLCKGNTFTTSWQGRLYIADPQNSLIAQKVGVTVKGEYAIKVR
ncbi:MAG TPA: transcription elongation factor subunit Spt4 [Candidatus Nanoarchaeia archaeon]|nr:transcription elongation factor subunit Spt4 [Candidatus Nanoarchaeia archaeon]